MNTILTTENKTILFIVAHTDDELIFFGSAIMALSPKNRIVVACMSNEREHAFNKTCKKMGAKEAYCFKARYFGRNKNEYNNDDPLLLAGKVEQILHLVFPSIVFTHGINGEYGHHYHVLVSKTVSTLTKESNATLLLKDPSGPISFQANKTKRDLLVGYDLPKPSSWNKYINAPETYKEVYSGIC